MNYGFLKFILYVTPTRILINLLCKQTKVAFNYTDSNWNGLPILQGQCSFCTLLVRLWRFIHIHHGPCLLHITDRFVSRYITITCIRRALKNLTACATTSPDCTLGKNRFYKVSNYFFILKEFDNLADTLPPTTISHSRSSITNSWHTRIFATE